MAKTFFESQIYHSILLILVFGTLVLSILSFANTHELKKLIMPEQLDINQFLKKLTSHQEMENYEGATPLNIIQINNANLPSLQAQIQNLDLSYLGKFIVQYHNAIVIYDYKNDTIKGIINLQPPLPQDFMEKLSVHSQMKQFQGIQPDAIVRIDSQSVEGLKGQSDAYKNVKEGHYLVRFGDKILIYDYEKNKIINVAGITSN